MTRLTTVLPAVCCAVLIACQSSPPVANRPTLIVPRAEVQPGVSADINDPAWRHAATIANLTPCIGDGAPQLWHATQVLALWRPEALYVRFLCRDDAVFMPYGATRDANHYEGDVVEVFLDPLGDQRHWIEVQLNPAGGVLDIETVATSPLTWNRLGRLDQDLRLRETWVNRPWNLPGLRTAARPWVEDGQTLGWIADFAVPAEPLLKRHGKAVLEPMVLRANLLRYDGPLDPATGRRATLIALNWAPVAHGCPHISPAAMGYLVLR